jgi:hypothetical protein
VLLVVVLVVVLTGVFVGRCTSSDTNSVVDGETVVPAVVELPDVLPDEPVLPSSAAVS